MKRCDDDIAVTREQLERLDVVAGDRAAAETMREQQHWKAFASNRKDRGLSAALHVRHDLAVRQCVVRVGIGVRRRVADEVGVGDRAVAEVPIQVAVVRHGHVHDERMRRIDEEVRDVTGAAAPASFPVRLCIATHQAREVLLDVAAAHRIRAGRDWRNDAENVVERLCVSAKREQTAATRRAPRTNRITCDMRAPVAVGAHVRPAGVDAGARRRFRRRPSELIGGQRQRGGAAVDDRLREGIRLRQQAFRIEARGGDLGAHERWIAVARLQPARSAIFAARRELPAAGNQSPQLEVRHRPLRARRAAASHTSAPSSRSPTAATLLPPRAAGRSRSARNRPATRDARTPCRSRAATSRAVAPPSRAVLRPMRSLAWMPVVPS